MDEMSTPEMGADGDRWCSDQPRNADFQWDRFDSESYLDHNYATLRDDDQMIVERVGKFFAANAGQVCDERHWRGIDVGSGTNLYPALAMLPFVKTVTLWEYSKANATWLAEEIGARWGTWDQFWRVLKNADEFYGSIPDPGDALASAAEIVNKSLFDLPERTFDIGTMFFVAESITADPREFKRAMRCFLRSLKPDAPFAAAFMRRSEGYQVGSEWFPAVAITRRHIEDSLAEFATQTRFHQITSEEPVRDGYDGMILVTGVRRASRLCGKANFATARRSSSRETSSFGHRRLCSSDAMRWNRLRTRCSRRWRCLIRRVSDRT